MSGLTPQARFLSNLVGCDAGGAKQGIGAVAGGALGAFAGSKLLKANKTIGTVAGAGVGAAAGSWVGCKMQRVDQAKAAAAETVSAERDDDQPSYARGETRSGRGLDNVSFERGVEPADAFDTSRSGRYVADGSLKIHSQPSATSPVVGWIAVASEVGVLASVPGTPWLLVGRDAVARGYVSGALLRPLNEAPVAVASDRCRIVHQSGDGAEGSGAPQSYRACHRKDGGWTMTKL